MQEKMALVGRRKLAGTSYDDEFVYRTREINYRPLTSGISVLKCCIKSTITFCKGRPESSPACSRLRVLGRAPATYQGLANEQSSSRSAIGQFLMKLHVEKHSFSRGWQTNKKPPAGQATAGQTTIHRRSLEKGLQQQIEIFGRLTCYLLAGEQRSYKGYRPK